MKNLKQGVMAFNASAYMGQYMVLFGNESFSTTYVAYTRDVKHVPYPGEWVGKFRYNI